MPHVYPVSKLLLIPGQLVCLATLLTLSLPLLPIAASVAAGIAFASDVALADDSSYSVEAHTALLESRLKVLAYQQLRKQHV